MKFFRIFLLSFLVCILASLLHAVIGFERWYGGQESETGYDVIQTTTGEYLLVGTTNSFGAGDYDVYVVKTDSLGDTVWTKRYGGSGEDVGYSLEITPDGGCIISGYTTSYGAGGMDVYLLRLNTAGDTIWTRTYGSIEDEYGRSIIKSADGHYVIAGKTSGNGGRIYVLKIDSLGDTLWANTYCQGGASSVVEAADSNYVVLWQYNGIHILKLNTNGGSLWTKSYTFPFICIPNGIAETFDGGFIITGIRGTTWFPNFFLMKTDSDADSIWFRRYGNPMGACYSNSVKQTVDDGFIVTGESVDHAGSDSWLFLTKMDVNGDVEWGAVYGDYGGYNIGNSVGLANDGGYFAVGRTESYGSGPSDVYFIKTDSLGVNVDLDDIGETKKAFFSVSPNPFRSEIVIHVEEQRGNQLSALKIYDIRGCLVVDLSSRFGMKSSIVKWNGRDDAGREAPAGIYIVEYCTKGRSSFKKIIKIK